jgi:hypothetical protein
MVIGIDLGNKSRNSIAVLDKFTLLDWTRFNFEDSDSAWQHRRKIVKQIQYYIDKYKLTSDDWILFEKINSFMHGYRSKIENITSLAFIQATIINEFSDKISIVEVPVVSWKAKVLGNRGAKKEDSIAYVEKYYPQVDLDIIIEHKRKGTTEIKKDDDTADAICIGLYGNIVNKKELEKRKVNYT